MIEHENVMSAAFSTTSHFKRSYSTPALLVFGQVAALTRSASGCNMDDSSGCSNPPSNMGPMA